MTKTKSVHIWMEPDEFVRYEDIAKSLGISFSELVRVTLADKYPLRGRDTAAVVRRVTSMNIPLESWNVLEREIVAKPNALLR